MWSDFSTISISQRTRIRGVNFWEFLEFEGKVSLEGLLYDRSFEVKLVLTLIEWTEEVLCRRAFGIDILHISQSSGILLSCRLENWKALRL